MDNLERRITLANLEVRDATEGQPTKLVGYAARFMQLSEDLGSFRERILPGAFKRTLAEPVTDILALYGHDWNNVLGRRSAGTLSLYEDSHGLRFEITPPNTTLGRDTMELVKTGYIAACSFGFNIVNSTIVEEGDTIIQELRDVDLFEVSLVSSPAYTSTSVAVRSKPVLVKAPSIDMAWINALQKQAEAELSL
jgi:HK97 family phage prohead protease